METTEKKKITEQDKIHEQWYKETKNISIEALPEFIRHLTQDYEHDYGTVCHAITAIMIATGATIANNEGITGFQAGCIMWEFIKHWMFEDNKCGLRLLNFDNMLYPQYYDDFDKTISEDIFDALQKEAKEKLFTSENACDDVIEHWKNIIDGKVPFGYKIKREE
jgi:ethanolamine ammonia-lyase large subunit